MKIALNPYEVAEEEFNACLYVWVSIFMTEFVLSIFSVFYMDEWTSKWMSKIGLVKPVGWYSETVNQIYLLFPAKIHLELMSYLKAMTQYT